MHTAPQVDAEKRTPINQGRTSTRPWLPRSCWPPTACPQVDAEKRTLIKALPGTLVLHLKRFEFDYETFQRWKVGAERCGCWDGVGGQQRGPT